MPARLEEKIALQISNWLIQHGFDVYWNKKNNFGFDTFRTEGSQKKPDLFVRRSENPHWWQTLIELKPSEGYDIRKGAKILSYCDDYVRGKIKYFVNEEEVRPKYFLVATECSPKGKLFSSDDTKKPMRVGGGRWRAAYIYKTLPKSEYTQTFGYVRELWARWRDVFEREPGTCVGVLLSDILDGGVGRPAFLCEAYKGNAWRQRWWSF